jgi:YVTN family beta-propeller protein
VRLFLALVAVSTTALFAAATPSEAGQPPFALLKTLDTGPLTNHVNIVHNANGTFAYLTIGGLNEVKVFSTSDFTQVATIPVGNLPHGIWPSGDGTRVYVGLENDDKLVAIDTLSNRVIATTPIGQAPQAVVYVPGAVTQGDGTPNLQPLGVAGQAVHLALTSISSAAAKPETSVSLFDQGLVQVLQAAVTGLEPKQNYVLALATRRNGTGTVQALRQFTTNPAGSAVVNTIGPIRQVVQTQSQAPRRYLVIFRADAGNATGAPVQIQTP